MSCLKTQSSPVTVIVTTRYCEDWPKIDFALLRSSVQWSENHVQRLMQYRAVCSGPKANNTFELEGPEARSTG